MGHLRCTRITSNPTYAASYSLLWYNTSRVSPPHCVCYFCKRDHLPRPSKVATGGGPRVCGGPILIHRALPPLAAAPDRQRLRGGRGRREIGSGTGVRAPFPPRILPVASVHPLH